MDKDPIPLNPQRGEEPDRQEAREISHPGRPASGPPLADTPLGLDVNYLLNQYGQAMVLVGQMESRIRALEEQIGSQDPSGELEAGKSGRGPSTDELQEELDKKERAIASSNAQLSALRIELGDVKAQLDFWKSSGSHGMVRRRRRHHRKWWHFWR